MLIAKHGTYYPVLCLFALKVNSKRPVSAKTSGAHFNYLCLYFVLKLPCFILYFAVKSRHAQSDIQIRFELPLGLTRDLC